MWRLPWSLMLVAATGLAAASCGSSPSPDSLTAKSCTVAGMAARCGTLTVPENRLTGKGRTIGVRFVVIPASGQPRAPDPVVYFAGGPGGSTVQDISSELPDLLPLNVHRDLVFIEQRGTGQSGPLNCPGFPGLADKAALRASVESCLARLHGDLRFYTSAMYADDVSQVLNDLHYAKANFMGISYGTAAEQVFLLRHPGQVRTLTMQSGSPLTVPVYERAPGNSQLALDYVFARCESQPACHRAFPHLSADWARLWASLGKSPLVLPAKKSPTGTTVLMDQDALAAAAYNVRYTGNIGPVPLVVHTMATARNKAAALAAVIKAYPATPGSGGNQMMFWAIVCGEPWFRDQPAALSGQRGSFDYHTDLGVAQYHQYLCPLIPKSAAAVGHQRLTMSTIPVLAFNGAADPIEQPRNWAGARKIFPDSRDIALPYQGHDVNSVSWGVCAGPLTQNFIEHASVAHLNTSCLASIPATPFDLTVP